MAWRSRSARAWSRRAGSPKSARPRNDGAPADGDSRSPSSDVGRPVQPGAERGARRPEPQPSCGSPAVAAGRHRQQGMGPRPGPRRRGDARGGVAAARRPRPRRRAARRRRGGGGAGRGRAYAGRAPAVRGGRPGGRQAPHRAVPQRSGGDRPPPLDAHSDRPAGLGPRRAGAYARRARPGGGGRAAGARVAAATRPAGAVRAGLARSLGARPEEGVDVLLAHAWPLVRDRQRLADARRRVAELPLGSGALAGSGFAVDRVLLKEALGFRSISANALDATGDRDFVAEVLFALALVGTHLSRLAAELVLYTSAEFGFVRLSDDFSTGSSLLPQKRNPDVFELARAKAGRLLGDVVALVTTLKGIPAGYSKDLQEDKALLFDAFDTLALVLPAVTGAIAGMTADADRMRAALDASLRATDLADLLVQAGVPFRESHGLVGRLVREAERTSVPLDRVPVAVAAAIHPALPAAVGQLGTWEDSVEGRATPGGASRQSVEQQIEALRALS